jgi:hypothetical protein
MMPFGGHDWLALTSEPTLEPDLPICDPHHHFWDFRTERLLYQRYLLHELADDIHSGHHVRATVFIEARAMYRADGPEEMRPVGEVEFVQGLAAASGSGLYGPGRAAAAIISHANLNLGDRVEPVLDALATTTDWPLPSFNGSEGYSTAAGSQRSRDMWPTRLIRGHRMRTPEIGLAMCSADTVDSDVGRADTR